MNRRDRRNAARLTRRELMRMLGIASAAAPFVGAVPPIWPLLNPTAQAQSGTPHRFLQIFLGGGWDSILATDPCVGSKVGAGYQADYHGNGSAAVAGKGNLILGPGLLPAASAFAQAPTAFVNGIFVEVTAHELAVNYLLSGRLSLSRSREYPAIIATMGDKIGGFPAHVVLGSSVPLGETAKTNPPLQSPSTDTFARMLAGPYEKDENGEGMKDETIQAGNALIDALDGNFQKRLGKNAKASLSTWNTARNGLGSLYAKDFGNKLQLTDTMKDDFGVGDNADSPQGQMAMALNVLKEGVSPFVTVHFGGFDTHQNHMTEHLPLQQQVATAINVLIGYLAATNDPDSPTKKLLETTTVLISSEFNRTPLFNGAAGTDHWQSGSVILMGNKVEDNVVIGSTDNQANAMDYNGAKLLPDHVAASILRALGFATEANVVSGVNLSDLFT
jgi:hypothetical protein